MISPHCWVLHAGGEERVRETRIPRSHSSHTSSMVAKTRRGHRATHPTTAPHGGHKRYPWLRHEGDMTPWHVRTTAHHLPSTTLQKNAHIQVFREKF